MTTGRRWGILFMSHNMYHDHINSYLDEVGIIAAKLDREEINKMIGILKNVRDEKGRLFILGVGGGAGHAGHAVNDFRKLAAMEAYAPTDNVSELTARTNDDGFHTVFANWLIGSNLNEKDAVMVFSVGGGSVEKNVSTNIVEALKLAKNVGAKVVGIVGRDGGFTRQAAGFCILIPIARAERITPHTEGLCAVLWHLLVSHPVLQRTATKWESVK